MDTAGTDSAPMQMRLPPRLETEAGETRRLGVEIEFGDLTLARVTDIVTGLYGGEVVACDAWRNRVEGSALGDFLIELDVVYAHPEKDDGFANGLEEFVAETIGDVSRHVVPMEIACPPIPLTDLGRLEALVTALREAGATGTGQQLYYAFGCQFNPELASLDAAFAFRQFQAYLLLEDWLRTVAGRDLARRLVAFANPFPRDYARAVIARDELPDWPAFIDSYIADNPTRNRDLDLLPLMAHIDESRVRARLDDKRIKARPTFHYRVPDSRVDEPGWTLTEEWNRWVEVELLAEDRDRFLSMRRAFLSKNRSRSAWADETPKWLTE